MGKGELFLISFVAALIAVPVLEYIYDFVGPKVGLPTL